MKKLIITLISIISFDSFSEDSLAMIRPYLIKRLTMEGITPSQIVITKSKDGIGTSITNFLGEFTSSDSAIYMLSFEANGERYSTEVSVTSNESEAPMKRVRISSIKPSNDKWEKALRSKLVTLDEVDSNNKRFKSGTRERSTPFSQDGKDIYIENSSNR